MRSDVVSVDIVSYTRRDAESSWSTMVDKELQYPPTQSIVFPPSIDIYCYTVVVHCFPLPSDVNTFINLYSVVSIDDLNRFDKFHFTINEEVGKVSHMH